MDERIRVIPFESSWYEEEEDDSNNSKPKFNLILYCNKLPLFFCGPVGYIGNSVYAYYEEHSDANYDLDYPLTELFGNFDLPYKEEKNVD